MNVSDVSRTVPEGIAVELLVSPRSDRSGPEGFDVWRKRMIVRVKAPPLDGRANREVESLFKEITGCRSEVVKGQMERQKTVLIHGDPSSILRSLEVLY
ncbi:MAG: DUF167 domain-containing protein [Candidatus Methanomethylophilaceae archaeon]|jgi:uncharacterized protein (TIGR00251 family)|nr:DUF167 domain-containing protein [Candidatus Methanomethylophilaceae archaeon]NLF34275.1 YggU family protein [Thermoplasmatales archaeon]